MQVKDVMSRNLTTVQEHTPLAGALSQMVANRLSCIVVVNQSKPVGIITERDVTREFSEVLHQGQIPEVTVNDIMTQLPVCVDVMQDFKEVLVLSRSRHLRHLPVVNEQEHLVGLVTQTNLVDTYAQLIEQQNELKSDLEALKLLSLEDSLLKIGNRRAMEVDLAFTQAEAKRHHKTFAIALFDIDSFKKYNDRYGHQAGDEALFKVAQAIKSSLRDSDRVFRYGGEEILALMPETDLEHAMIGAERARQAVQDLGIEHLDSAHLVVTISGGVASEKEGCWKDLVGYADKALYQAKDKGRNQIAELASKKSE